MSACILNCDTYTRRHANSKFQNEHTGIGCCQRDSVIMSNQKLSLFSNVQQRKTENKFIADSTMIARMEMVYDSFDI